ncbi:hypothetical protein ACFL6U_03905 [Planctomycetota bacterium]
MLFRVNVGEQEQERVSAAAAIRFSVADKSSLNSVDVGNSYDNLAEKETDQNEKV